MKILFLILFFTSLNVSADLSFNNAWVKNAPPIAPVRAAYVSLTNDSDKLLTITKITSPQFQSIEAHETFLNNGVYSMKPIHQLTIPAKSRIDLKPKGKHLMLMMPTQSLQSLTSIQLELHTDNNQIIQINAPIKDSL